MCVRNKFKQKVGILSIICTIENDDRVGKQLLILSLLFCFFFFLFFYRYACNSNQLQISAYIILKESSPTTVL